MMLKAFALATDFFLCASLSFDLVTGKANDGSRVRAAELILLFGVLASIYIIWKS